MLTKLAVVQLLAVAAHALHVPLRAGHVSMQTVDMRRQAEKPISPTSPPQTSTPPAPSAIRSITSREELDAAVAAAEASRQLAIVKVFAPWCRTCMMVKPRFARISRDLTDVNFYEIDFSKNKDLCKELDITALPTMRVYREGELVGSRPVGIKDFRGFEAELCKQADEMRGKYVPRDSCSLNYWNCVETECDLTELTAIDYDTHSWNYPRASLIELPNEADLYAEER